MLLTIVSALLGFFGPFVPEIIKIIRERQDNAHELSVLKLQVQITNNEHLYRMEEIGAYAEITDRISLQQPKQSFGVSMLDATKHWPKIFVVPVFYLFTILDLISALVRPGVTYALVGFYIFYKVSLLNLIWANGADWKVAVVSVWTNNDWAVLLLVLGFYFGQRTVKATFGGSASSDRAGTI